MKERLFYVFVRAVLVGLCRSYLRMKVTGRENVPTSGSYIVAPNHRSFIDTPIAAGITKRRLRFMGKEEFFKGFFGWAATALGAFPVSRGTADREAFRRCNEVVANGEPLVMFPEGARMEGPTVDKIYDGASFVAIRAGVPILPVGIAGSEQAMPKGAKFIWPRRVHVHIGELIYPPTAVDAADRRKAISETTAELHTKLQSALDEAQRKLES